MGFGPRNRGTALCLLVGALVLGLATAPGAPARDVYVLTPEANDCWSSIP